MFPYADAHSTLDWHNQRVAELSRRAAEHRLAREISAGRRTGRWPRRRGPAEAPQHPVPA